MTKQAEIKLLDETIKKFGDNSYIGPWLRQVRTDIIQAIELDLPIPMRFYRS